LVFVLAIIISGSTTFSQTSSFTYQGRLTDGGTSANGNYDLQFALFDSLSGGAQVGSTQSLNTVAVSNGVFTVSLDFGASAFNGAARFLEISARPSSGGAFTLLSPRQPITSTPYAVRSLNATTANVVLASGVSPGSGNYIQNNLSQQASSNFNISGTGTANIVNATTQYNLNGNRILSNPGNENLFVGFGTGSANTGDANGFFGPNAGQNNTTGGGNAFFGFRAGLNNTTGGNNVFFGTVAGQFNTTGSDNAFFGTGAGLRNTTGNRNTIIGLSADVGSGNLTNATAIGFRARADVSNSLVLGSINGINGATADTSVGIGTTMPTAKLSVVATGDGARVLHLGTERGWVFKQLGTGSSTALELTGENPNNNNKNLVINTDGNVGIGNIFLFEKLTVDGSVHIQDTLKFGVFNSVSGSNHVCEFNLTLGACASSLRYKTDVRPFLGGLDLVNRLRPISFQWKVDGSPDVGLGAEEVAKVEPRLVTRNAQGEILGVKYSQVSAVLINAIKEQQTQIKQQHNLIEQQQKQIAGLKEVVCRSHPRAPVCE
jgi:hypothetical protein